MLNDDNPGWGRISTCVAAQLLDSEVLTVLKVLLMLLPSVVTIEMQATRISASITAYSTAVGPSSLTPPRIPADFHVFGSSFVLRKPDFSGPCRRGDVWPGLPETIRAGIVAMVYFGPGGSAKG